MSGSLLLIAVVWLVLLAPLLLRNQRPVRRTAQALNETRVILSGGAQKDEQEGESAQSGRRMPTLRKLKPSESLYKASDDEDLELVDAEPEYIVFDDEDTSARPAGRFAQIAARWGASRAERKAESEPAESEVLDADVVEPEIVDGEIVDTEQAESAEPDVVDAELDTEHNADSDSDAEADAADAADTEDETDAEVLVDDSAADDNDAEDNAEALDDSDDRIVLPEAYLRGGDVNTAVDTADDLEEPRVADEHADYLTQAQAIVVDDSDEITDEDIAYANSRKGRGVYDPVASQRLVKQRQKRRAQVLMGLAVLTVLTGILGVTVGHVTWLLFAAVLGFTVFYLVALRRTAVEEARLRQRRLTRMRRARLGVRNAEDEELGIPDRLRRPGAIIVEADDMDPEFQHLSYIDGGYFYDNDDRDNTYYDHSVRAM
ncbi:DUF3329 domain-containing protein [Corynebacterium sp. 320]|uniref:divisome protein SepX/GlpR n=1 Tax=Corynebacterium TaxID=1716 RepID=UPI00125CC9BA|nr:MULTISPECIES: gephyrin-like molybdotransferase receptor GlpR [Corynebacterium]KAB1504097.1 DUF3329 domain-containing protein [Corynebacterium sp. 320]KAB3528233.1 DUF3329 domain-containing protein [Corynebacterium sp. 250]QNP91772.1 DUF3329 domain-containing protein [Corynebacterium zhongnanshanii]